MHDDNSVEGQQFIAAPGKKTDSRGSWGKADEMLATFTLKLNAEEVKRMTLLPLTFALDLTQCDFGPRFVVFVVVVVVVARRHAAHDRRMTRDPSPRRDQSIFARQRGATSRFASDHVRLGPVRRVPRVTPRQPALSISGLLIDIKAELRYRLWLGCS